MKVKGIKNGRLTEQILHNNKDIGKICQSQLWATVIYIRKTFKHWSHLQGSRNPKARTPTDFFKQA
jgi:hypothetical protein